MLMNTKKLIVKRLGVAANGFKVYLLKWLDKSLKVWTFAYIIKGTIRSGILNEPPI